MNRKILRWNVSSQLNHLWRRFNWNWVHLCGAGDIIFRQTSSTWTFMCHCVTGFHNLWSIMHLCGRVTLIRRLMVIMVRMPEFTGVVVFQTHLTTVASGIGTRLGLIKLMWSWGSKVTETPQLAFSSPDPLQTAVCVRVHCVCGGVFYFLFVYSCLL